MDDIIEFLERQGEAGGRLMAAYQPTKIDAGRPWTVGVEFGREAEDSDMAAGAAYGVSATFEEALGDVKRQLQIGG